MKKNNWYKIQAKDDSAEISIFGDIGASWFGDSVTAADFKKDFDKIKTKSTINVILNSPGGDVFDGIAIYNTIAAEREKVSVEVIALAASAASVIALAGSTLKMAEGSMLMIHNVWSIAMGNADEFRKVADDLDKISNQLVNIYEQHSNLSAAEIKDYMDEEKWFDADEAVAAGFADETVEYEKAVASATIDPRYGYKHIPAAIAASAGDREPPDNIRDFEGFLRESGYSRKKATDIAAHGFVTDQGDPEPEEAQGEPAATVDETDVQAEIPYSILVRMRENENYLRQV